MQHESQHIVEDYLHIDYHNYNNNSYSNSLDILLVVNKSYSPNPFQLISITGQAIGKLIDRVGCSKTGFELLESWTESGENVRIVEGLHTCHLYDLRLAASCTGLEYVEIGNYWDIVNRRYREVYVLGLFGSNHALNTVAGRLPDIK